MQAAMIATSTMLSRSSAQAATNPGRGPNVRRAKLVTPLASGIEAEASA